MANHVMSFAARKSVRSHHHLLLSSLLLLLLLLLPSPVVAANKKKSTLRSTITTPITTTTPATVTITGARAVGTTTTTSTAMSSSNRVYSWNPAKQGGIPGPRSSNAPPGGSACDQGASQPLGYACVHMAMLSDDMIAAAKHDGLNKDFIYAVAGAGSDSNCGECYQVKPTRASMLWKDDFKQLIVQVINSGSDVASGQLDVFMAAGGMGIFNAVSSDCSSRSCNGGPCNSEGMFGGDFDAWAPDGQCYGGGLRALNASNAHLSQVCGALTAGGNEIKDRILIDSCMRTNKQLWHQNFVNTRYVRVRCPEGLYRLTGLRRSDDRDDNLPDPHVGNDLWQSCNGDNGPCISTMHDGCLPSCSWDGKGDPDPTYPRVDRCNRHNAVIH